MTHGRVSWKSCPAMDDSSMLDVKSNTCVWRADLFVCRSPFQATPLLLSTTQTALHTLLHTLSALPVVSQLSLTRDHSFALFARALWSFFDGSRQPRSPYSSSNHHEPLAVRPNPNVFPPAATHYFCPSFSCYFRSSRNGQNAGALNVGTLLPRKPFDF